MRGSEALGVHERPIFYSAPPLSPGPDDRNGKALVDLPMTSYGGTLGTGKPPNGIDAEKIQGLF